MSDSNRFSKVLILRGVPFLISFILFFVANTIGDVRIETVGPNGLALILYPYSGYAWALGFSGLGVFTFAVSLSLSRAQLPYRSLVGSLLAAMGVPIPAYVGLALSSLSYYYDMRCIAISCPPFLQLYFEAILPLFMLGAAGIALLISGSWLLVNHHPKKPSPKVVEQTPST